MPGFRQRSAHTLCSHSYVLTIRCGGVLLSLRGCTIDAVQNAHGAAVVLRLPFLLYSTTFSSTLESSKLSKGCLWPCWIARWQTKALCCLSFATAGCKKCMCSISSVRSPNRFLNCIFPSNALTTAHGGPLSPQLPSQVKMATERKMKPPFPSPKKRLGVLLEPLSIGQDAKDPLACFIHSRQTIASHVNRPARANRQVVVVVSSLVTTKTCISFQEHFEAQCITTLLLH